MKKLLTSAFALIVLMFACALSEEEIYIASETGGVIDRGTAPTKFRALIRELDVAYMTADTPYLTKGVQTRFTVHATGGDGRYTYNFTVYRRTGTSGAFYLQASAKGSRVNTYVFMPKSDSGQYVLLIRITDSAGSYIEWQSEVYESATHAAARKAKSLAEECMREADTDYARALWLHDWLIKNAEYDHDYKYFYPEGVLLYGKGVCQSYALAYEMLLRLVGIDNIYVVGWAGGAAHGWNIVKIAGNWYHVDCTWDDPSPGKENHDYFCVPDNVIARDHYWKHETPILPVCNKTDYMYAIRSGAKAFENQEEFIRILNESLLKKRGITEIWYTGPLSGFDFAAAVSAWKQQASLPSGFNCCYTAASSWVKVEFDFGNGYQDPTAPESVVFDLRDTEMEAGEGMKLLIMLMPSTADAEKLTWKSSNPECVKVENGYAEARKPGVCVISVSHANGVHAEITLYVNSNEEFVMPRFMSVIENEAFSGCALMETVILQSGISEIGEKAFADCALLKTISIPDSVSYIGKNAFSGCGRVVIECSSGSYAHSYALEAGIECRLVSNKP